MNDRPFYQFIVSMIEDRIVFLASAIATVVIYLAAKCLQVGRRPKNIPPRPPTVPILGNLHLESSSVHKASAKRLIHQQMPKDRPWLQFTKWAEEYG
jgi:hypothetical protein